MNFHGMKSKPETPKVGVGVILKRGNMILLGLRKCSHGAGQWSLPGGHMELGEEFLTTCQREVKEECGMDLQYVMPMGFTNDIFPDDGLHYVTLFFEAVNFSGEPENIEPDKLERWEWFDLHKLPENIWSPLKKVLAGSV